jgi:phage recombination protein Bet
MAQPPAPLGIAPRSSRPANFGGTDASWRVLCDLYPSAETAEIIMAVVEYCGARRLDPLRKPVHIVPMWNEKLRRRVQVVMSGINEIETTAHRSGRWAGMDEPRWGPLITRKFRGESEGERGEKRQTEVELTFPEWCSVTVYRIVNGQRVAFTEQLFWLECYGRAGFRSTVPNARWQQAPRQMLHKCTKAATLRAAFPEEAMGYAAEEMEDRSLDAGGVTIEGRIDHGDPGLTEQDRRVDSPPPRPQDAATGTLADLDIEDTRIWLKAALTLLERVDNLDALGVIATHRSMNVALDKAPTLIKGKLQDALKAAHERIAAAQPQQDDPADYVPPDRLADLLADIERMDLFMLNGLASNAQWRARVRDACEIPPDEDRLDEAIAARKAALRHGKENNE